VGAEEFVRRTDQEIAFEPLHVDWTVNVLDCIDVNSAPAERAI
jgi:hypothetical protein